MIDGVDESDSPRLIVKFMAEVISMSIPIHILLVSRKTQELYSAFQKLPKESSFQVVTNDGHSEDLRFFVDKELDVSGNAKFREKVSKQILEKAHGNFLWVHLAIQSINKCHTEDDVRQALAELPPGMEPLYDRMAQMVAENPRDSDRKLASSVLAWVTCALRILTVEELLQALDRDVPQMLDLQRSIGELCGGFVVIDSDATLATLLRFLRSSLVLTWIQALAQAKQLRGLIHASTSLSSFAAKRRRSDREKMPLNHDNPELEIIESWAVDFVKIVGKFGSNLSTSPESIYKLIPPFCPRDSIMFQRFGKKESNSLMVSGFSNACWDDSLARLSFRSGVHASAILAAGNRIAVLTVLGPLSVVHIHHCSTFEEMLQIQHGERVLKMSLNAPGTLLTTFGYATTKFWNTCTGKLVTLAKNPSGSSRPHTVVFTDDDNSVLVGTDDRRVWSIPISNSLTTWNVIAEFDEKRLEGTFVNSPSCMALSPDGTQVALGYRGHPLSLWEVEGPNLVCHYLRAVDASSRSHVDDAWGEVIQVTWHPYGDEILGLHLEGDIFKWNPYSDENAELRADANKLVVSQDGNFFATGDVNGNVKLYSTADFSLLYQLMSQDPILDLTFSPDTKRFYDVRGSYASIWEPSALLKILELTDRNSDIASEAESFAQRSIVSEHWSGKLDPVTTLAAQSIGSLYCTGNEAGINELFDVRQGRIGELGRSKNFMSTEQMVWSENGRYVGFADLSGKVFIKSILANEAYLESWMVETQLEFPANTKQGPVRQLLFNPHSTMMLVHTASVITVISIAPKVGVVSRTINGPMPVCKWVNHPSDPTSLLCITPLTVHIFGWTTLTEIK